MSDPLTKDQCTCGHNRLHHRAIGGREICNISPCCCMNFEALTSNTDLYPALQEAIKKLGQQKDEIERLTQQLADADARGERKARAAARQVAELNADETTTPRPYRVRLLKDIFDDGQDHHPPGYIARKGDVVVIHSIQTAVVSHHETGPGFVVHDGELEVMRPEEPSGPPLYRHDWETLPGPSYRCKRCKTTCLDAHDALLCAVRPVKSKPRLRDSDAAFNLGVLPTEQPEKATEQLLADRDRLREVNKIALDKAQEALEGRSVEMDAAEKSALYGNIDHLTRKE